MIPSHASAPLASLVITPPRRCCDMCGKAEDQILWRPPGKVAFACYDCNAKRAP